MRSFSARSHSYRLEESAQFSLPFLHGLWFDSFWIIFLALVTRISLVPDLNSLAWLIADALSIYAIAQKPKEYIEVFRRNILLLSWPAIAIVSTIWSLLPELTLFHAIQFFLNSVVAFVMIRHAGLERFVKILFFFGFLLQVISVLLFFFASGQSVDEQGNFKGVYLHKNELGVFSTLQIICATSLLLSGWRKWLTGFGLCLAFFMLLKSGSGTSAVLTVLLCGLFPTFLIMRRGIASTGVLVGSGVALVASLALTLFISRFDPVAFVLDALGKDAGLTGRDLIWRIGMDAVEERPGLGVGFLAYWQSSESTAEYLRYVLRQQLVAFHNVYLETTVAFGLVGLSLLVLGLLQQYWRGIVYLARAGTVVSLVPLLYMIWISVLGMSENPIFWNSQLNFILMALGGAICGSKAGSAATASY